MKDKPFVFRSQSWGGPRSSTSSSRFFQSIIPIPKSTSFSPPSLKRKLDESYELSPFGSPINASLSPIQGRALTSSYLAKDRGNDFQPQGLFARPSNNNSMSHNEENTPSKSQKFDAEKTKPTRAIA